MGGAVPLIKDRLVSSVPLLTTPQNNFKNQTIIHIMDLKFKSIYTWFKLLHIWSKYHEFSILLVYSLNINLVRFFRFSSSSDL